MIRWYNAIPLLSVFLAANFQAKAVVPPPSYVPLPSPSSLTEFVFESGQGMPLTLRDFRGHFILLNLWATWCAPCVKELPALDALAKRMENSNLIVIALNENSDGRNITNNYFRLHELTHLKPYDDTTGTVPSKLKTTGLPTTLLLNQNGLEIGRFAGSLDWTSEELTNFLLEQLRTR